MERKSITLGVFYSDEEINEFIKDFQIDSAITFEWYIFYWRESGDTFGYYNSEGKIEYIMEFSRWAEHRDGVTLVGRKLVLHKDGIVAWETKVVMKDEGEMINDCRRIC